MAGTIVDSQLSASVSSRVRFTVADEQHDGAIRRLLRENPMPADVTLTLEREPDYFLGSRLPGVLKDQTIIALEGDRVVCMGGCQIRERYLNGERRRVGYLSGLRLDHSVQGRFDIVRRGYQFFVDLAQDDPADFYFTSISSDNVRSIRLLERGLPGMPQYRFLTEYVTLLVPVPGRLTGSERAARQALRNLEASGLKSSCGSTKQAGQIASFLNNCGKGGQLASRWTEDELFQFAEFGLPLNDFQLIHDGKTIVAAIALWDQRRFKQTIIRSYSRKLSLLRPWLRAAAGLFDTPQLPKLNSPLAHAFLSPCASQPEHQILLPNLIRRSMPVAAARGIKFLTLGFAAHDPRLAAVRTAFRCREYSSRLYQVAWTHDASFEPLDSRPIYPEVALL